MSPESSKTNRDPNIEGLRLLLEQHRDKRVIVVGGTCIGKSTMLSHIPGARDMDAEVFPQLTKEESDYVCQDPWTEKIGRTMTSLVRERVKSAPGRPVFGTVVIDCDFIILLNISDGLLAVRTASRNVAFTNAKNMHQQIRCQVEDSPIPWVEYQVG